MLMEEALVHSFGYAEFLSKDRNHQPKYKEPITVDNCRIDYETVYSRSSSEKQVVANAIIFCYVGYTTPLVEFKEQSKVTIHGKQFVIEKVVPITNPFNSDLFAYELEVI